MGAISDHTRAEERAQKIGFILQDPFLFSGTVRDNIVYGNEPYKDYSSQQLAEVLEEANLSSLISRFSEGLDTVVTTSGNSISLGQKQLIAFMRAALRKPELLILDEATANIDTVTEELLQEILLKLPATTTRVIIAHRLNTIDNVDQIFFVNSGRSRWPAPWNTRSTCCCTKNGPAKAQSTAFARKADAARNPA